MDLSATEARRIAITAQGLANPPASVRAMAEALGAIQLDSVNVVVRSHYLPAWSRLGHYDTGSLDALAYRDRTLFEYWGHEASLLPIALYPLFRWRMARAKEHAWRQVRAMARRRAFLDKVLAVVAERGPIGAGAIELGRGGKSGWWEWSESKCAIEWLFYTGHVAASRRDGFERLYDLTERVVPAEILATKSPREHEAQRELIAIAARALGVATELDLRDYFRLRPAVAKKAIAELVDAGVLAPVSVEGWTKRAYLHRDATASECTRSTLLSPFDSLVWNRDRTERLFGMRYRLELYTPAPKRVYGYYVLPFLLGDRLVARVDLKADRATSTLIAHALHAQPGIDRKPALAALRTELRAMATWLGLDRVTMPRGFVA